MNFARNVLRSIAWGICISLATAAVLCSSASAADTMMYWYAATGNWNDASWATTSDLGVTWTTGLTPAAYDYPVVNAGSSVTVTINSATTYSPYSSVRIGSSSSTKSGIGQLIMYDGTLTITPDSTNGGNLVVGNESGSATEVLDGSSVTVKGGTLTIDGDVYSWWLGRGDLTIGTLGNSLSSINNLFTQTGGTINVGESVRIASAGASTATYIMSGGQLNVHTNSSAVSDNGSLIVGGYNTAVGEMYISGDSTYVNIDNAGGMILGAGYGGGSSFGTVYQSGGYVSIIGNNSNRNRYTASGILIIGRDGGSGVYNLSGGTLLCGTNGVALTYCWSDTSSSATFNLDGGLLRTYDVHLGAGWAAGTGTFNFNGGTIMPTDNNTAFMEGLTNAYVKAGGAIIDTANCNVTIGQSLLSGADSDGGLTKINDGILTLTGANSYNGDTKVNGGTLILQGSLTSGGGNVIVNSGGTLQTSINLNRALVVNGGTVNTDSGPATIATTGLTITDGSTLNYTLSNVTTVGGGVNDLIAVTGDLSLAGTSTISVTPSSYLVHGNYTMVTYTGALTGGAINLSENIPSFYNASYTPPASSRAYDAANTKITVSGDGTVKLYVAGGPLETNTWNATVNKIWNVATTGNWINAVDTLYYDWDNVQFGDTGAGTITINAGTTGYIQPGWITVNNSQGKDYEFTGHYIAGAASYLVKNGSGTLTFSNNGNTFNQIYLNGGKLVLNGGDNTFASTTSISVGSTLNLNGNSPTFANVYLVGGTIQSTSGDPTLTATYIDLESGVVTADVNLSASSTDCYIDKNTDSTITLQSNAAAWGSTIYGGKLILDKGVTFTATQWLTVGSDYPNSGTLVVKNGATVDGSGLYYSMSVGYNYANGYVYQQAGSTVMANVDVGYSNGVGYYQLDNAQLSITSGSALQIGYAGVGVLDIIGADANIDLPGGATLALGDNTSSSVGTINQYGGTVTLSGSPSAEWNNNVLVGPWGTGIYNQLGGVLNTPGYGVTLAWGTGTGIYNLNGGVLETSNIHSGSVYSGGGGSSYFNFNGGTLKPTAESSDFIYALNKSGTVSGGNGITRATVFAGGAIIDTSNGNTTIKTALEAPSGNGVTEIALSSNGSGYKGTPTIQITSSSGVPATAYAVMEDDKTGNGTYRIASIVISSPGTGYGSLSASDITISGGEPTSEAVVDSVTVATNISGGLTKLGSNTLTLTGALTYGGTTDIQAGTLQINTSSVDVGDVTLAAITGASSATLGVGDGTNPTSLTATSVAVGTLTIGAGSTLTIAAIDGGPSSGSALTQVPEPSTIVLLALAGLGLLIGALRNRRS